MKRSALVLLAPLAILSVVYAGLSQEFTDRLSWDRPSKRVDGAALAPSEILQYRIAWGPVSGGPYTAGSAIVDGAAVEWVRPARPAGRACYVAVTVDTGGLESKPSTEACSEKCALPTRINAAGDCEPLARPRAPVLRLG